MSRLFGTDGVRGVANLELTPELAFNIGFYAGEVLGKTCHKPVIIGRDTRYSGDLLYYSLASGFMAAGIDVIDVGVISTPGLAYLVKENDFTGGAVISASHNPYEYNGIKLFNENGFKLTDEQEDEIEAKIDAGIPEDRLTHEKIGRVLEDDSLLGQYENYLLDIAKDYTGLKIALDLGNGALSGYAREVLEKTGAEVVIINDAPDGKNINDKCGSTNPDMICDLVKETGADIGFSFDGDADRIIAVDETGEIIDGDHMMAILARNMKNNGTLKNDVVVGTVMSNMGLDEYLDSIGARVVRTNVGDRYVLEEMLKEGYNIGGEQSGHIIMLDYNTTGDGLASGIHLLNAILEIGEKPSVLNKMVKNFPQVLVNAKVSNDKKYSYMENETIKCEVEKIEEEFKNSGRVNIRPSGTEPLVRVMIEGKDQEEITKIAENLAKLIEKELS